MTNTQVIEKKQQIQASGFLWTVELEKIFSRSGKSASYMVYIYRQCGICGPVGQFRSLKAAKRELNSFTGYTTVAA